MSTAIGDDNPELVSARAAGARDPPPRRPARGGRAGSSASIAVAGTHGKTTTCLDDGACAAEAGRDPAFLIGGELRRAQTNAAWGAGDWIVVEADESDRSFLKLARDVAVVTNIELDHHAHLPLARPSSSAPSRSSRRRRAAVLGPGVELARRRRAQLRDRRRATCAPRIGRAAAAADRASGSEGCAIELPVPGQSQRAQRARGAGRVPRGRCRAGRGRAQARALRGHGPPLRGPRHDRDAARACSTTTPTIRPRCAPRSPPRAPSRAPARGLLPAAPLLAHASARARVRRALALADLVVVLDVYPARERAEDFPGRDRAARGAGGGRRRRGPRVLWLPAATTRPSGCSGGAGRGRRAASRWARGTSTTLARRLTGVSAPARGRPARLPARAPDHRAHRGSRRLLRPPEHRGAPGGACSAWAESRGARGRSGGVRIESSGSRCRIPRTRHEAGRSARLDRARGRAACSAAAARACRRRRARRPRGARPASSSA